MRLAAAAFALAALAIAVSAVDNGLGRTPPMGWNSWNQFQCNVNETVMMEIGTALFVALLFLRRAQPHPCENACVFASWRHARSVSSGLAKLGYVRLDVDDCWAYARSANGTIEPDPITFPSGMAALADFAHSLGLRFGLYTDLGNETCAGRPGSLGYETIDADTYARWGVDLVKVDNCFNDNIAPEMRYPIMGAALNNSGRAIFFAMCEWGDDNPAEWAPAIANSWRTTGDIKPNWASVLSNLDKNNDWATYAGPGGWNDPDMLEVGVVLDGASLSQIEQQSHFSLWALVKAPLILGLDVRSMSSEAYDIISNAEVIAVNQDPLGAQGRLLKRNVLLSTEIWASHMADGSVAVILFNRGGIIDADIKVNWPLIGLDSDQPALVRDLWQHADLGTFTGAFEGKHIPPHGVQMLLITPQ